jgi:hypothetical protein
MVFDYSLIHGRGCISSRANGTEWIMEHPHAADNRLNKKCQFPKKRYDKIFL